MTWPRTPRPLPAGMNRFIRRFSTIRGLDAVRGEEGFTLVEMMVVLVALGVLLAISIPIISTVYQTTSRVDLTYTNMNAQLSLSTNLQRLLRAAVAPEPSFDGSTPITPPKSPFEPGEISPTSLTFFANTGTANGPEEVSASCTKTSVSTTLCKPTTTFRLAIVPAKATTCPFSETTTTKLCTYASSPMKLLLDIPHVTNGDSSSAEPLFTYAYGTKTVCSDGLPTGCSGSDSVTFASAKCKESSTRTTSKPFTTCPAGEIDAVDYDLKFNVKVTPATKSQSTTRYGGLQAKTVSGAFVMSSTTVLYNPAVG